MNEIWMKRFLIFAAGWNLVGGASALLDPAQHFAQMYHAPLSLEDPLQLYFYRCTWINVMAWGVGYFLAAIRPAMRMPILAAGAAGKFFYCFACLALFANGTGQAFLAVTGVIDLLFAGMFAWILMSSRQDAAHVASQPV
jgi:hypothetical protein